jgi:hypothetical protein
MACALGFVLPSTLKCDAAVHAWAPLGAREFFASLSLKAAQAPKRAAFLRAAA